jgi:hypothetical protein
MLPFDVWNIRLKKFHAQPRRRETSAPSAKGVPPGVILYLTRNEIVDLAVSIHVFGEATVGISKITCVEGTPISTIVPTPEDAATEALLEEILAKFWGETRTEYDETLSGRETAFIRSSSGNPRTIDISI